MGGMTRFPIEIARAANARTRDFLARRAAG